MAEGDTLSATPVAELANAGLPMDWITAPEFINDTDASLGTPLPAAAAAVETANPDAAAGALNAGTEATTDTVVDAATAAAAAAATGEAPAPVAAADDTSGVDATTDGAGPVDADESTLIDPATGKRPKTPTFMDRFRLPVNPVEGLRDHLRTVSPARANDLELSIVQDRLSDPAKFAADYFASDPVSYAKLATEVVRGDPATVIQILSGREGIDAAELKTRLDFYDANKDRVSDLPASDDQFTVSDEQLAEWEEYFPGEAQAMKARFEAAAQATAKAKDLQAQLDQRVQAENAGKPTPQQVQAQAVRDGWKSVAATHVNHVKAWAESPQGLNLAVTAEEKASTPLIATAKQMKYGLVSEGLTIAGEELFPSFEKGFTDWAGNRPEWKEGMSAMEYYINRGETANATKVAQSLTTLIDDYKIERMKSPIFQQIDQLLQLATAQATAKPNLETVISGGLPAAGTHTGTQGQGAAAGGGFDIIRDALARA